MRGYKLFAFSPPSIGLRVDVMRFWPESRTMACRLKRRRAVDKHQPSTVSKQSAVVNSERGAFEKGFGENSSSSSSGSSSSDSEPQSDLNAGSPPGFISHEALVDSSGRGRSKSASAAMFAQMESTTVGEGRVSSGAQQSQVSKSMVHVAGFVCHFRSLSSGYVVVGPES